jgi:hypothetical protein
MLMFIVASEEYIEVSRGSEFYNYKSSSISHEHLLAQTVYRPYQTNLPMRLRICVATGKSSPTAYPITQSL